MGSFSLMHWIIVLVIVALIFGTRRLRTIGEDVGAAVRGFKEGMKEGEHSSSHPSAGSTPPLTAGDDCATPPRT